MIKVLLVEDNPGDVLLLRRMLGAAANADFELVVVERAGQAVEHLAQAVVDVILLDLSLPDTQGLETVQRVQHAAPTLPIVVLTGNDDAELAIQAVNAGAQDYLVKGITDPDVLVRAIRYSIERAHVLQELRAEIAHRAQVEASLQQANAEVETASQAKSEFYSRMSHELRTPLNAILGFGQLLEMDHLSTSQQQSVTHIMQAGYDLLHLVDQLLQISSSDAEEVGGSSTDSAALNDPANHIESSYIEEQIAHKNLEPQAAVVPMPTAVTEVE